MKINFFPEFEQRMISNDDIYGINSPIINQSYSILDTKFLTYLVENENQPNAIEELAERYHFGIEGLEKNYEKSFILFKKAADFGHPDALFMIANYYLNGNYVNKNYNKYFEYLDKARKAGSYLAWMNYATAYHFGKERYEGFGVEKDYEKSVECNIISVQCIEEYWNVYSKPNYRGFESLLQRLFNSYITNVDLISQHYETKDKEIVKMWLKKGNAFVFNACGKTHPIFDEALKRL